MNNIYETQFKAWNCDFILEIIGGKVDPEIIVADIKSKLTKYEDIFSRFKPDSDLTKLNQGQSVTQSPTWENIITTAKYLASEIEPEYFNPHVNLATQGYQKSFENLESQTEFKTKDYTAPAFPEGLIVSENKIQLKPAVYLDFGSFLKGYVSSEIADKHKENCTGIIINFGGDIAIRGTDTDSDTFEINIYNPITNQDHPIQLQNQSLCTSGTYKRTWLTTKGSAHHIINPLDFTSSKSDFISISFWGPNGALCDAFATAAFNAAPTEWDKWIKNHPDTNYLAIYKSGENISSIKK